MKKQYTVFSNHHHGAEVDAKLADGTLVKAIVDSVKVQLVNVDPDDTGTIMLQFTGPANIGQAEALFVEGSTVTATFEGE